MVKGSLALSRALLDGKEQEYVVELADGPLVITAKWLMVNIFLWRPLVSRGLPVEKRHVVFDGLVTSKRLAKIQTMIYKDVIGQYLRAKQPVPPDVDHPILEDLCEIIDSLHTMIVTQLGEYHLSVSAFELADLLLHPEIKELTTVDVSSEMQIGITATEDKLRSAGKKLVDRLKDRTLPSNVVAPFLELGQLSEKQLAQVLLAIGFRTDANESIVRKPILTSYIRGITSLEDYAIESLMAKKTVYYNKNAMPDSSYNNRKQQLLSSTVRRLYPGDCGSTVTVPFYIHTNNAKNTIDKNIIVSGQTVHLTEDNIGNYIGTTVQLRSPLTCRHTDGLCHTCGGHLTDFIPPQTVVGISCTIEYMASVSQLVLSAKHFSTTKAISYIVNDLLRDVLVVRQNDIYIREGIDVDRLKIGIQFRNIHRIAELRNDEESEGNALINEQQFSAIHFLTFASSETDTWITPEVPMLSDDIVPYLSSEVLAFIRDNPRNVEIGEDMVWISLKRFNHINEPLLRYVIQSNSMLRFTATLSQFATKDIRQYTSLGEALGAFSEMVYKEIPDTNIFHLETVLKSYLITDDLNYNIPVVTDPNNVRFGTLLTIIPRRSLGTMFAYERLAEYISKEPEMYTLPHRPGIFDTFFFRTDV